MKLMKRVNNRAATKIAATVRISTDGVDFDGSTNCSTAALSEIDGCSCAFASDSFANSDSKQSRHTPLALTGVVHLLYFFPQDLQMAMMVTEHLTRTR